ncbi:MAG TPA: hypothetical protein VIV40_34570 [Kofleriaceae bacterium]
MARQRRGGGFRPPELRGTLGTLLRTTLAQAGTLRDALERGAREGRSRLDSALSGRRRQDALADLGDIVLDLIRRGEIDIDELPEVHDIVAQLDEIDAGAHDDEHAEPPPTAPARNRFDSRRPSRNASEDDGTVSSKTWSRPRAVPAPGAPTKTASQSRVWRPPSPAEADTERPDDEITARGRPTRESGPRRSGDDTIPARPAPRRSGAAPARRDEQVTPPGRKDPARKGGIHFDDDEDLAEYMHPDDVPPKGTPEGDS